LTDSIRLLAAGLLSEEAAAAEASATDMKAATMEKSFIVFKLKNKQLSISQTGSVRQSSAHQMTNDWYGEWCDAVYVTALLNKTADKSVKGLKMS
jgi:hypothetical protein